MITLIAREDHSFYHIDIIHPSIGRVGTLTGDKIQEEIFLNPDYPQEEVRTVKVLYKGCIIAEFDNCVVEYHSPTNWIKSHLRVVELIAPGLAAQIS